MSTSDDPGQGQAAGEPPAGGGPAGVPAPPAQVGSPHYAQPWRTSIFSPLWTARPTKPFELVIPTLQQGKAYDVDTIMRHAAFGLLCWFLDNEYPGHVAWEAADVEEMADLRQWWETHWNMEPMNDEAYREILHMHHRLVEISMRLWV